MNSVYNTYIIGKRFEIRGDGSYEHPFDLGGGEHFALFAHFAIGKKIERAFFRFSGHTALAHKNIGKWKIIPMSDNFPYAVESIEEYLNQGYSHEAFFCFAMPVEDPVLVSAATLKALVAFANRAADALAAEQNISAPTADDWAAIKAVQDVAVGKKLFE